MTEIRKVITKSRATMGVATLEDLQGTIEVIVFPKVYEQTEPTWAEDAILLVAGRVDHKGDETVLLADAVWTWEDAQQMGSAEFTRDARANGSWPSTWRGPVGAAWQRQRLPERQRLRRRQGTPRSRRRGTSRGGYRPDHSARFAVTRRRGQRHDRGPHRWRAARRGS